MIAMLAVIAAAMFVVTHFVARSFEREQHSQAQFWFQKGQSELKTAQVQEAIHSFRSALAYSRENFQYRLLLAQALVGDQQLRQAESYLLALWSQQPGNGTVNLELGRIEAQNGDYEQALRYYHGAVYGIFNERPEEQRRQAWLELVEYLLRVNAREQAQAELIALAGDLPRDPDLYVRVAEMFQQAREPGRAQALFHEATELAPRNQKAWRGAGKAAFDLQQYVDAQRDLRRAVALDANDTQAAELLELATLVRQMSPFIPRLSSRERARRVVAAFTQATNRVEQCATQQGQTLTQAATGEEASSGAQNPQTSELQAAYNRLEGLKPQMRVATVVRRPELADSVLEEVARAEEATARLCGPLTGPDQAVLLIWRQREQAEQ